MLHSNRRRLEAWNFGRRGIELPLAETMALLSRHCWSGQVICAFFFRICKNQAYSVLKKDFPKIIYRSEIVLFTCIEYEVTLISPSIGNCFIAFHLVTKNFQQNVMLAAFCIPEGVKRTTKILKMAWRIIILRSKIISTRSFSIVKMLAREVNIFPEKSKISNFFILNAVNQHNSLD